MLLSLPVPEVFWLHLCHGAVESDVIPHCPVLLVGQ